MSRWPRPPRPERPLMHILVLHNYYAQRGGEDVVVEAEVDLLRRHGHEVRLLSQNNRSISPWTWLSTAWNSTWNEEAYRVVADQLRERAFDVAHVHNFFP